MPRFPRELFEGAIHHIGASGNDGIPIFLDNQDHRVYRRLLLKAKRTFNLRIFHWNQMTTHVHFITQQMRREGLSDAMQWIQTHYARYFNKRNRRSGHVWDGRFWSRLIKDERDLLACGRYVERNPVEAKIVERAHEYPWSSTGFYIQGLRNDLIDTSPVYESLGNTTEARQAAWKALLEFDSGYKAKRNKIRSRGTRPQWTDAQDKGWHLKGLLVPDT